jgi:hypothetical protein
MIDRFRRVARWLVFGLLALMWLAVARLWFDPPPFEPDPFPFVDGGFEAFAADERARIELDREDEDEDDGGNPSDRKESR